MAPQSIFRKPDAKHYSVLHRSQRDPLINDPTNGERILHEIQRKNQSKPQTIKDCPRNNTNTNLEPSSYNIFYDDPDYDYLQHLRPIGTSTDAIFIGKTTANKKPNSHHQSISLVSSEELLPSTVQATPDDQTLSYQDHLEFALPSNSAMPDNSLLPISDDPALREVLDALEDEAYVEEETDDTFFESIIKDGEIHPNQPLGEQDLDESEWKSEISEFESTKPTCVQFDDTSSKTSDTFTSPQPLTIRRNVNGVATSARGSMAGSAFSMSSSAMFRNEGLTDLDDRFDQIEKEYQSDDDEEESNCSETTTTPKVREDFEAIMDEFLDRFEVLGGKMKPTLAGKTPIEKLDTLRTELLGPSSIDPGTNRDDALERKLIKEKILSHLRVQQNRLESHKNQSDNVVFKRFDEPNKYENKWDCQTILSTYSNLENHPRVIRIREAIGVESTVKKNSKKLTSNEPTTCNSSGKIGIDRLTGFPVVDGKVITPSSKTLSGGDSDDASSDDSDHDDLESNYSVKGIIKRDRNEDKESKKLRKSQLKAERAVRRQVKKSIKQSFTNEKNKLEAINSKLLAKKSADIAGVGGKHVISLI